MKTKLCSPFLTLALVSGLLPARAGDKKPCASVVAAANGPGAQHDETEWRAQPFLTIDDLESYLAELRVQTPIKVCIGGRSSGSMAYREVPPQREGPVVVIPGEKVDISVIGDKTLLAHGSWKTEFPSSFQGSAPSVIEAGTDLSDLVEDLWGRKDSASWLLTHGASVNVRDHNGNTPLHWAAMSGHTDGAKFLVAGGADVNARADAPGAPGLFGNNRGDTPLHLAAFCGNTGVAKFLVSHGADVNAQGPFGDTPLKMAVDGARVDNRTSSRCWAIAALLRQHGGHTASDVQQTPTARPLPVAGQPPQRPATASESLVKVVQRGDLAALRARLLSGANPNEADDSVFEGWTPLMEAAHNGDVEDARLLLDSGASVDAKTLGKTALDVALTPGRTRIAEKSQVADLLRSRGAKSAQAQTSDHPVRAAASSAPVGGGGGRQAIPVPVPTAFEDKQAEALAQQGRGPQDSESAWKAAEKDGTPTAYLDFYRSFPQSPHIKAVTGTLRGRYWFRMHFEWERDQSPWEGVVVSVEGLNVAMNLPLEDAKRLGVIKVGPAAPGVKFSTEGVTFNYVYFEPTGGGVLAHDGQMIAPRDFLNSTIVLSADEQRLLAWDNGKATEASQPSQQPTIKEGADGNYPCGAACPKPR